VYNSVRTIEMKYRRSGDYTLHELHDQICASVEQDDDILTQFMDGQEIKAVLERRPRLASTRLSNY
jgi:hypothetical protein